MKNIGKEYGKYRSNEITEDDFYKELREHIEVKIKNILNDADREDLTQEVCLRIWKTINQFKPTKGSFNHWLNMTVDSVTSQFLSKQYKTPRIVSLTAESDEIGEIDVETVLLLEEISTNRFDEVVDAFEEDKELLDLLLQGYSFRDCEEILGVTRMAIEYRLKKVRKRCLENN